MTSQFPVILSIENHASKKQQITMAHYLEEILGDMLIIKKIRQVNFSKKSFKNEIHIFSDDEKSNPSPNQLKNKFILKAKIIEPLITITNGPDEKDIQALNVWQGKKANRKTAKELADLVVYSKATKLINFEFSKKYSSYDRITSINSSEACFNFFKNLVF